MVIESECQRDIYHQGNTALHFALHHGELEVFCKLLDYGANCTIKNDDGKTVVHQALDKSFYRKEACWTLQGQLKHPFVDAVLEKQVSSKNTANPHSADGLSHLHAACMTNNAKAVEFFLESGALVNKAIEPNANILPGYTPLHLAVRYCALEAVGVLLDHGANLHFKNAQGMNPLHMLIDRIMQVGNWFGMGKKSACEEALNQLKMYEKVLQLIFNKCYTYKYSDYVDEIGLSSLHIGCFKVDSSIVKALFKSGYNMVLAIRANSPIWPGYTALHFAVQNHFAVTAFLLEQGANILAKDAKGVTPFDLILQLYQPKTIHSVILTQDAWKDIVFSDAKTKLADLVLAMNTRYTFEFLLMSIDVNIYIPADSPLWPGFTPLHLAIISLDRVQDIQDLQMDIDHKKQSSNMFNCSQEGEKLYFDRIKVCMDLGADITIENAEGSTPLHLAFKRQKYQVVNFLLQNYKKTLNPVDKTTGLSYFHIACAARNTLLAEKLLLEGVADVNGNLPLSLPYQRVYQVEKSQNTNRIAVIHNENAIHIQIVFTEVSSKLHVFHLSTGSTPLHIAVAAECPELMEALLKMGADVYAKDGLGLTPVHRMLTVESPQTFASCLESLTDLRDCTLEYGLSHLHVVCSVGSEICTGKLLAQGANVEAALTYQYSKLQSKKVSNYTLEFVDPYDDRLSEPMSFLAPYSGYRPLHFAVRANSPSVVKVLLEHGADILAKSAEGSTPLYDAFADEKSSCREVLIRALESDVVLQGRMQAETGLTMLHFLCFLADLEAVTDKLIEDVDVNARARQESPLWAGCTPLHVLMKAPHDSDDVRVGAVATLMLARGADVSAVNTTNESPIHMAHSRDCCHDVAGTRAHSFIVDMLKAQKDYAINPVNHDGVSHFHIACMWDVEDVVEKFLKSGVNPNDPIDYFKTSLMARLQHSNVSFSGGSSPIQLALIHKSRKVFDLLLGWGVDLKAVDRHGKTPLNVAATYISQDETYFQGIIESMKRSSGCDKVPPIDLNSEDIYGTTPLQKFLDWEDCNVEIVKIFIKEGCRINAFNSVTEEGYLAVCIPHISDIEKPKPVFDLLMADPKVLEINGKGRNAFHNAVSRKKSLLLSSSSYLYAIDQLEHLGCDIDLQDCSGQTPLHLATRFQNLKGILGLLECGADINLVDADQKPAFAYIQEWEQNDDYENMVKVFSVLVYQFHLCGLHVNEIDNAMYRKFMTNRYFKPAFLESINNEREKLKERKIGAYAVTLGDFLSETGAVAAYPHMIADQRQAVDELFQSEKEKLREDFELFRGLLFMQYRKARKRVDLLARALPSLNVLTDLQLPYLCSKRILKFLRNNDLDLLVASTSDSISKSV